LSLVADLEISFIMEARKHENRIMTSISGKLPDKDADWEIGKWYHVAWTLEENHEIAYVNGIQLGEHNKANAGTRPGTHPLEIGRRVGGSIPLTGAVDEVIVLNVALEIRTSNSPLRKVWKWLSA